jgi:lysophospholipase L1-like esterase
MLKMPVLWLALGLFLVQGCNDPSTEIDTGVPTDQDPTGKVEEPIDTDSATDTTAISFLALGDSYTIGTGVEESEGWPERLVSSMRQTGFNIDDPVIIARAGWTTGRLLAELDRQPVKRKFDIVSLQIGVNNQYIGQGIATFKRDFEMLLDSCVSLSESGKGVFVLSIPDYGASPFGSANAELIGMEIDAYNAWISEKCNARNIRYYDITDVSRLARENPSLIAPDDLHPSGEMYQLWVNEIISGVSSLVERLQTG